MCNPIKIATGLKIGEEGTVCCLKDEAVAVKLMEMGCIPGTKITMEKPAPLGDPIRINIGGEYSLSLRKEEADTIMLR